MGYIKGFWHQVIPTLSDSELNWMIKELDMGGNLLHMVTEERQKRARRALLISQVKRKRELLQFIEERKEQKRKEDVLRRIADIKKKNGKI